MKSSFSIIAALGLTAYALCAPAPASTPIPTWVPSPYTLTALLPGNDTISNLKVEAGGFAFSLGGSAPATYCPAGIVDPCPPGNETVLAGGLGPYTEVPGGQQGFVTLQGNISYTQAHSISEPAGSYVGGWSWAAFETPREVGSCDAADARYDCDAGTGLFTFAWEDEASTALYACPYPDPNVDLFYTLLVAAPEFVLFDGCLQLEGLVSHTYTGPNPNTWQYT
jgi:hypothetical protein